VHDKFNIRFTIKQLEISTAVLIGRLIDLSHKWAELPYFVAFAAAFMVVEYTLNHVS
jgi:hypothetical protein